MLKNNFNLLSIIICLILADVNYTQDYPTGLLLDEELYRNTSRSPVLLNSDYSGLPVRFSLESFTPPAGHQQGLTTCAGWAVSYYGRSILESIKYNLSEQSVLLNSFSPSFVYNQIRTDSSCFKGVALTDALNVLIHIGSLKLSNFEYDCSRIINNSDIWQAKKYRIKDFREIFSRFGQNKITMTRKSLFEKKPVVIAIDCAPTLKSAGEFWFPLPGEYKPHDTGHALTVIAYDDSLNGGSFKIINSWGLNWGKEGKTWIRYKDFEYFAYYGYELVPFPDNEKYSLAGDLKFVKEDGTVMECAYNGKYFQMERPCSSGTKFQVYLKNQSPAYAYVFSTDLNNNPFKIFPHDRRTSAFLPYRESNIALPDEFHYNIFDDTKGKSYYIFMYSKNEIDFNKIIDESKRKNIVELLKEYFGTMNYKFILKEGRSITFKTDDTSSLIYILVEFKHI